MRSVIDKKVREIRSTEVRTLGRNDNLGLARDLMKQERIRHFPVLDGGRVVGVVSQRGLFHATLGSLMNYDERSEQAYLASVPVKEVMEEPAVTISPEASVKEAASLMVQRRIGCLPVVEDGQLRGILTETDILRQVAEV